MHQIGLYVHRLIPISCVSREFACTVKFENILYANDKFQADIKLVDFGLSRKIVRGDELLTDSVGTVSSLCSSFSFRECFTLTDPGRYIPWLPKCFEGHIRKRPTSGPSESLHSCKIFTYVWYGTLFGRDRSHTCNSRLLSSRMPFCGGHRFVQFTFWFFMGVLTTSSF